jgi:predicted Zn finger-like uncharacterized protein
MATRIICPACGTRYETKAVFPPEGRKVRCSKCAHVWQAFPIPDAPEPALAATPAAPPAPVAMPPQSPPPPAAAVNMGMRGFAGIAPTPPAPPRPTPAATEADLAAQVARINAEAMAEAPVEAPPEKRGGIFARLTRNRALSPPPPAPSDAGMSDTSMSDTSMSGAGMSGASMGDASMDEAPALDAGMSGGFDTTMGDAGMGIDPALAEQALPDERAPRKKPSIVPIGWLVLALVVASVIGTLALAPTTVMSILPGAARLYGLFGGPVGAHGLAFESVRYGWASDGGQSVLEVQGDVVNLTGSTVAVPTVIIALRDAGGEEISEWTTEIGAEQLAAGERAPFLRQIPSPPSNVRSVKVRFAKAK